MSTISCPSIPGEYSEIFKNYRQKSLGGHMDYLETTTPTSQQPTEEAKKEEDRLKEGRSRHASVKKTMREQGAVTVSPNEYSEDRESAMKKTPSSKLGRYNYGGYIPASYVNHHTVVTQENYTFESYLQFLKADGFDFLMHVIIDEEAVLNANQKALEDAVRKQREEEKSRMREEAKSRKVQRRLGMIEFKTGMWNALTGEYLREMKERDTQATKSKSVLTIPAARPRRKFERRASTSGSPDGTQSTVDTMTLQTRSDSMIDLHKIQKDLEQLWTDLKMSLDQRIDMAIKYSSPNIGNRAEPAVALWKDVAVLILEREALLKDIEEFEKVASNPTRFFKEGYEGSSVARIEESNLRQQHLESLETLDKKIMNIVKTITTSLGETVTYEGKDIIYKIRHDYIDLLTKVKEDWHAKDGFFVP